MQITCLHVLFLSIFSICLFIYFNWCQQNQVRTPTCICLFMQMTCWHVLSLWILISLCLLIIIDVNTNRWMRPPVFVYLCKVVCWNVLSLWILISICWLMKIYVNTNATQCRNIWTCSSFNPARDVCQYVVRLFFPFHCVDVNTC